MKFVFNINDFLLEKINDNFRLWFNRSKIVKNNEPLVMYNGSDEEFNIFNKQTNSFINNELGYYFSDNENIAKYYGKPKKYYLSIKNPKHFSDIDFQSHLNYMNKKELKALKKELLKKEYDGISYSNNSIVVAFYSNQIKSIDNDGSWDTDDDNIYS